jgi:hypothetical protein
MAFAVGDTAGVCHHDLPIEDDLPSRELVYASAIRAKR